MEPVFVSGPLVELSQQVIADLSCKYFRETRFRSPSDTLRMPNSKQLQWRIDYSGDTPFSDLFVLFNSASSKV